MAVHRWADKEEIERIGASILDGLFSREYIIVPATREHQRQHIDRFFIDKRDARNFYRVDYKIDRKAGETKNLAFEEVSVMRQGKVRERGWIHTTIAEWIIYLVPSRNKVFVMDMAVIRKNWQDISRWPLKEAESDSRFSTDSYCSRCHCAPIEWLRSKGLFLQERSAVGAQLLLAWKWPA